MKHRSNVPRSLRSGVSTIQSVVLKADVFQFLYLKYSKYVQTAVSFQSIELQNTSIPEYRTPKYGEAVSSRRRESWNTPEC